MAPPNAGNISYYHNQSHKLLSHTCTKTHILVFLLFLPPPVSSPSWFRSWGEHSLPSPAQLKEKANNFCYRGCWTTLYISWPQWCYKGLGYVGNLSYLTKEGGVLFFYFMGLFHCGKVMTPNLTCNHCHMFYFCFHCTIRLWVWAPGTIFSTLLRRWH